LSILVDEGGFFHQRLFLNKVEVVVILVLYSKPLINEGLATAYTPYRL